MLFVGIMTGCVEMNDSRFQPDCHKYPWNWQLKSRGVDGQEMRDPTDPRDINLIKIISAKVNFLILILYERGDLEL